MKRRSVIGGLGALALASPTLLRALGTVTHELYLYLDVSDSMLVNRGTLTHWQLQQNAHAAALLDSDVQKRMGGGSVLLKIFAWGAVVRQDPIFVGVMQSEADFIKASKSILSMDRSPPGTGTVHVSILEHVLDQPLEAEFRVVDISTDESPRTDHQRQEIDKLRSNLEWIGTRVNGFAIESAHFSDNVGAGFRKHMQTTTPGSFTVVVKEPNLQSCTDGLKRKLMQELS